MVNVDDDQRVFPKVHSSRLKKMAEKKQEPGDCEKISGLKGRGWELKIMSL